MNKYLAIMILIATAITAGCSAGRETSAGNDPLAAAGRKHTASGPAVSGAVAMTRIYKTNGDYADKVPVTLNAARTAVVSYPAPTDVAGAAPVKLGGGYLLDRRGVGANTAFTRWTYDEYSEFSAAPSPEEIMGNILPAARVIEVYSMPFVSGTPDAQARCDSLIASGLPGCTLVYSAPVLNL